MEAAKPGSSIVLHPRRNTDQIGMEETAGNIESWLKSCPSLEINNSLLSDEENKE